MFPPPFGLEFGTGPHILPNLLWSYKSSVAPSVSGWMALPEGSFFDGWFLRNIIALLC